MSERSESNVGLADLLDGSTALYGDECPGERGNTRKPRFGEWMRGVWASEGNPQRDGMYVETRVRKGRLNPGTWYRLTDGRGRFWEYEAKATVFLPPNAGNNLRESGTGERQVD